MAEQSRTQSVGAAIQRQLAQRAASIDVADDLGEITITIKLAAGTTWVRSVVWEEERVFRQGASRRAEDH